MRKTSETQEHCPTTNAAVPNRSTFSTVEEEGEQIRTKAITNRKPLPLDTITTTLEHSWYRNPVFHNYEPRILLAFGVNLHWETSTLKIYKHITGKHLHTYKQLLDTYKHIIGKHLR